MVHQPGSLFCHQALLPTGWARDVRLCWQAGRFSRVEAGASRAADEPAIALAIPGLGNLHSHAFQRAMAGLAEQRGRTADSFWTWREIMYQFLDRLTPEDVAAIAAQAYAEMLEAGFTRVGEFHYLHHDPAGRPYARLAVMAEAIADAASRTGIALTLLPCFYAQGGFAAAPPNRGQIRFLNTPDRFARLVEACREAIAALPQAVLGLAPHSLRAVTPEQLATILPLAANGPIHIHAAEQMAEVEACLSATGQRPVAWLLNQQSLDARWCLIHATHMTADETIALAASGATAGLCPLTEASLGDGVFSAPEFQAAGGRFGIGTDSNIQIDAAAELRQLEYAQRLTRHARNVLAGEAGGSTGLTLFQAALAGGATALGAGLGGFSPGAPADIVALDPAHPSLAGKPAHAILDGHIFAAARPAITDVWCQGVARVRAGRHARAAEIGATYAATLRRLLD